MIKKVFRNSNIIRDNVSLNRGAKRCKNKISKNVKIAPFLINKTQSFQGIDTPLPTHMWRTVDVKHYNSRQKKPTVIATCGKGNRSE